MKQACHFKQVIYTKAKFTNPTGPLVVTAAVHGPIRCQMPTLANCAMMMGTASTANQVSDFGPQKRGKQFTLFWKVEDTDVGSTCNAYNSLSLDCLNAAKPVLDGSYTTSQGKNLSHLVFYNSREASLCETEWCFTNPEVNEPPTSVSVVMTSAMTVSLGLLLPATRRKKTHS